MNIALSIAAMAVAAAAGIRIVDDLKAAWAWAQRRRGEA